MRHQYTSQGCLRKDCKVHAGLPGMYLAHTMSWTSYTAISLIPVAWLLLIILYADAASCCMQEPALQAFYAKANLAQLQLL